MMTPTEREVLVAEAQVAALKVLQDEVLMVGQELSHLGDRVTSSAFLKLHDNLAGRVEDIEGKYNG